YPMIIALSIAVLVVRVAKEFVFHDMRLIYLEYLVNYDLGFVRRGLVPQVLSFLTSQLTHFDVKIFAVIVLSLTFAAYAVMYATRFGLNRRELPLFALTVASPAVFKNFACDFARLDIFGCLVAIVALALPVGRWFSFLVSALCCLLVLIHEA